MTTDQAGALIEPRDMLLITAGGEISDYKPASGKKYTLEELRFAVDGYIELVHLWNNLKGKRFEMVVNEEGKLPHKNLKVNVLATRLAHLYGGGRYDRDVIVGSALVVGPGRL